jgi:ferredoxin
MKVPGVSFWAISTALLLFVILWAVGMPLPLAAGFGVLWYLIGAGAAYAVMNFHHPHRREVFTLPEGALTAGGTPPGFCAVTFTNQGRTVYVREGGNLREAAVAQGVQVYYDINKYVNCFGLGHCGTCRFRPDAKAPNALSEPSWQERFTLGDDVGKVRLACQTYVFNDCAVDNTVAVEFGKVRHFSVVNGALVGAFSLLMLAIIIWMGGDMIGLF